MRERQAPGMQTLPLQVGQGPAPVQGIPQQGMTQVAHVDTNLMSPPGVQFAPHQTSLVLAGQQSNIGAGRLAHLPRQIHDGHPDALPGVAADGLLNRHLRRPLPSLVGQGQIFTLYLTARHGADQRVHRSTGLGHHHQTAGVLVESVHDTGSGQQARAPVMRQQPIEQRTAPVARRRMHHQPDRLVDHQ